MKIMKNIPLLITILMAACVALAAAAPANDNFANSQVITPGLTTTNISTATVEAGEPETAEGRTVWYRYTATSDSIVTIDSTGTNFSYHFINVYMGSAINSLINIDSGYSGSTNPFSFSFKVKAGSTYRICAGNKYSEFYGSGREVKLTLFVTPFAYVGSLFSNAAPTTASVTNDRFDQRTVISGTSLTVINYMEDAGVEAGEPDTNDGKTAWYTYYVTSDSIISIDTTATEFSYHFVSVYMGTSINNLIKIASDYSGSETPFTSSFKAKAGTTFQICVGSTEPELYGSGGLLQFTLTTVPFKFPGKLYGPEVPTAPTPKNDSFNTPQVLSGNSLTVIGSNTSATIEPGESGVSRSLHYTWSSPIKKRVIVDISDASNFDSGTFGVFRGSSPQTAVQVPPIPGTPSKTYAFDAEAGTTYRMIVASQYSDGHGLFQFTLTATAPPVNYGPTSRITFPKSGQRVSRRGFDFDGTFDDKNGDEIVAYEFRINGKTVVRNRFPSNESRFSGRLKKGKLTLQMRSKDSRGKWGPYHTIRVTSV